jgi:hypothetical protein
MTHDWPENAGNSALTILSTSATNSLILLIIYQVIRISYVAANKGGSSMRGSPHVLRFHRAARQRLPHD